MTTANLLPSPGTASKSIKTDSPSLRKSAFKMEKLLPNISAASQANEAEQISRLFKRVRLHMKENPIHLEENTHSRPAALSKESLFITSRKLESSVRKRRSSDMDDLTHELRDKCTFEDET